MRALLAACLSGLVFGQPKDDGEQGRPVEQKRSTRSGEAPVHVLAPGFHVRGLAPDLPNINNVRYRDDGKLVAVGYNGTIYLLSDLDRDGHEETVEVFSDATENGLVTPIDAVLTPARYPLGRGVFVAAKGKVTLLLDIDGDDRADTERIVASGWSEKPHRFNKDALGIAMDREGFIYFGLGTLDSRRPYRPFDKETGKSRYASHDRGRIWRVSPDFKRREVFCSGVRYPVALCFNRRGELFATDQEGDTWGPKANSFDELLHLERERHYGFPPGDEEQLPGVVDEPSVYDYGPQHQSTCGLLFNEATDGRRHFGPSHWEGDAFVAGFSRGKIFRTKLARAPAGYIAHNEIFAALAMLTVDMCVSPEGHLVIACHGGNPDWGTGPGGRGKLFKVFYTDLDIPQPVIAWAASPTEVRIAFDRPVDPCKSVEIRYGNHVRAGDPLEVLWPGYEVVKREKAAPVHPLGVASVKLSGDRRTLVLETDPYRPLPPNAHLTRASYTRATYAVRLPGDDFRPRSDQGAKPGRARTGPVDLQYRLTGVEARWDPADPARNRRWTGWLPHFDLDASRSLTVGSAEHETLFGLLTRSGLLRLRSRVELPRGEVTLHVRSSVPFAARFAVTGTSLGLRRSAPNDDRAANEGDVHETDLKGVVEGSTLPLEIELRTGSRLAQLHVSYHTQSDATRRVVPVQKLLLPWCEIRPPQEKKNGSRSSRHAGNGARRSSGVTASPATRFTEWEGTTDPICPTWSTGTANPS